MVPPETTTSWRAGAHPDWGAILSHNPPAGRVLVGASPLICICRSDRDAPRRASGAWFRIPLIYPCGESPRVHYTWLVLQNIPEDVVIFSPGWNSLAKILISYHFVTILGIRRIFSYVRIAMKMSRQHNYEASQQRGFGACRGEAITPTIVVLPTPARSAPGV